jgi:hypothetical protein
MILYPVPKSPMMINLVPVVVPTPRVDHSTFGRLRSRRPGPSYVPTVITDAIARIGFDAPVPVRMIDGSTVREGREAGEAGR